MTSRQPNRPGGNMGAPPGTDPTLLALARTQRAVMRLAKHLKIDLSDDSYRNAVTAQDAPKAADSSASTPPSWERPAAFHPASPSITPQYVQEALNTYHEIDDLLTNPE